MPTHEFTFPGGRATITTETGGTIDHPGWAVEVDGYHMGLGNEAIFGAEILRLRQQYESLLAAPRIHRSGRPVFIDGINQK